MKVIQITDTHLFADNNMEIFGVKSNITFNEVIAKLTREDLYGTDAIFLTGDLSQDESKESYQKIADQLTVLNLPVYWLPGNHDNVDNLISIFEQTQHFIRGTSVTNQNWHFIFINTKIDGKDSGYLSQSELNKLRVEISKCPAGKKITLIMHHHPAPVGTPLIDNYILENAKDFWDVIANTNIELIICGHVHGDYQFKYNNVQIESSPATCLQWCKGTTDLKIEMEIGYKIYHFTKDGYDAIAKIW